MGTRVSQTEWLRPFGGYWVAGEGHERLLSLNNTLYLPVWVPRSGGGGGRLPKPLRVARQKMHSSHSDSRWNQRTLGPRPPVRVGTAGLWVRRSLSRGLPGPPRCSQSSLASGGDGMGGKEGCPWCAAGAGWGGRPDSTTRRCAAAAASESRRAGRTGEDRGRRGGRRTGGHEESCSALSDTLVLS